MSKAIVAREIQELLEQMQALCARGERIAISSGLVEARWFRGAQTMVAMAAGDLQQKGLLTLEPHAPVPEKEKSA